MLTSMLCLAFPLLLLYAAWQDVSTMLISNWVSALLALLFVPAAMAAGLTWNEIGWHLVFGAIVLMVCAVLFYLNVFGGGDAKVIAAASLWIGLSAVAPFAFWMALAGGVLAGVLLALRKMKLKSEKAWLARLLNPEEGAPYAVAIAIGALVAAPASPVIAAGLSSMA